MPLVKFYPSVMLLIFLVLIDITLTLGGRDRGLNIIDRLGRIENNQVMFLKGVTSHTPTP